MYNFIVDLSTMSKEQLVLNSLSSFVLIPTTYSSHDFYSGVMVPSVSKVGLHELGKKAMKASTHQLNSTLHYATTSYRS
jgi:hypothetical protein